MAQPAENYDFKTPLTHEEYFALEEEWDQKFEYIAGDVFAMSGGSVVHGLIGKNTTTTLDNVFRDYPCTVFNSDTKLQIDSIDSFFYPDAMVLCEDGEIEKDYVRSPQIIIEVLSPSTEGYDHGRKFAYYRQITSLQTYIMLHQDKPLAEVYQRCESNGWLLNEYEGMDTQLPIKMVPLVDLALPMSDLYRQVRFPQSQ